MARQTPSPILQLIAGIAFFFFGIKEYGKYSDGWTIGLIALGGVLLAVSLVRLSLMYARARRRIPSD
jgi:hypothetical protein